MAHLIRDYILSSPLINNFTNGILQKYLSCLDHLLVTYVLPLGLIIQLTGVLWLGKGNSWAAQTYIWLIAPAFVALMINIKKIKLWRPGWAEIFMVVFLIWALISSGWSDKALTWSGVAKRCIYITLYIYAIVRLGETPEKLQKFLLFCCFLAVSAALLSLIYRYGIQQNAIGYRQYRIFSLTTHRFADLRFPIWAGIYYSLFLALLFNWQTNLQWKNKCALLFSWSGVTILAFYIMMTWSRGPWVGIITGIIFAMLIHKDKRSLMLLLIMTSLIVLAVYAINSNSPSNEIIFDKTYSARTDIWKTALLKIKQHPWLGHGFHAHFSAINNWGVEVNHPHNYFLQVLYFYGIPGGFFFMGMLGAMGKLILKYRHHMLVKMGATLLVVSLVCMLTDVQRIITRPNDAWLYIWLPVGLILSVHYQQKHLAKKQHINDKKQV